MRLGHYILKLIVFTYLDFCLVSVCLVSVINNFSFSERVIT